MHGKAAYLARLTSRFRFKSVELGESMQGSTPPSIFIGRYGYPKVQIGPMIAQQEGDTSSMDTPELWIPGQQTAQDIINFRLQLIRGKAIAGVKELDNRLVGQMQEIALAESSVDAEAVFSNRPSGYTIHEEHSPFGPSANLQQFNAGNVRWQPQLEKVYRDTDLKAANAAIDLYNKGMLFSQIQKAFSAGTMGIGRNRKLVPTRWSITAVDDTLGKHLLEGVRQNPAIQNYQLFEHSSLGNYFAVLLIPTQWRYQWMEAFMHVMGKEEVIFGDWEGFEGKKGYSSVGGCYYTARFAVAEYLANQGIQAGVIIFREAYPGYIPLGVWNVRENMRAAMKNRTSEFSSLRQALLHITGRLQLPLRRWISCGELLESQIRETPADK